MFIIVPSVLIGLSIVGIIVIIVRKMPYLKKLSPESHEMGDTIVHDFFPEVINWFRVVNLREYRKRFLHEIEKLLRRLRVASLKIDHASDSMIKRIRKSHLANHPQPETVHEQIEIVTPDAATSEAAKAEELKNREQQLIVEIAQNPKDFHLYESLAELYLEMNNEPEAKEAYEAALALDPHNQDVARKYSQLLKKLEPSA